MIKHLGIQVKEGPGNRINRELYLQAKPEGMIGWKQEHYDRQIVLAGLNFDANMKYMDALDPADFDAYLSALCKKYKFRACNDLAEISGKEGLYLMVLDDYKQLYVGVSSDMKKRIQNHWRKRKSLERLIFGDACNSTLSVDSFGPLDTTRVFYIETSMPYEKEERIVSALDPRYSLNRTAGGIGGNSIESQSSALIAVMAGHRNKNLIPFLDIPALQAALPKEEYRFYLRRYPALRKPK